MIAFNSIRSLSHAVYDDAPNFIFVIIRAYDLRSQLENEQTHFIPAAGIAK